MGLKNKLLILLGITLCCFSFFFILVIPIIGIILLLLAIFLIYKGITMKEKLNNKDVSVLLFISLASKMNATQNEFLDILKEEKDYKKVKDYYKDLFFCIEKYIHNYSLELINFTPKRPINPYVAAGIGSSIAGPAEAYISYNDASKEQDKYDKLMQSVNERHSEYNESLTDFETCFYNIEDILLKYDTTREKWLSLKESTLKEEKIKLYNKRNKHNE